MNRLYWIVIASLTMSCAHGKMGQVDQELATGSVSKTALISVETISAREARFSGDKSGEEKRVNEEKAAIENSYSQRVADALRKKGYNAKAVSGAAHGLVLSGKVTRFEHGSAAARIMVGMGAGSSNIFTDFKLEDRDKAKTLSKFEVIATSGGRGGLAAAGSFMDSHMEDGAEKAADYIDKANLGKK
jgi:hypothetical protein